MKSKYKIWEKEYKEYDITWEDFRDNYFKCDKCGVYQENQCICYAR